MADPAKFQTPISSSDLTMLQPSSPKGRPLLPDLNVKSDEKSYDSRYESASSRPGLHALADEDKYKNERICTMPASVDVDMNVAKATLIPVYVSDRKRYDSSASSRPGPYALPHEGEYEDEGISTMPASVDANMELAKTTLFPRQVSDEKSYDLRYESAPSRQGLYAPVEDEDEDEDEDEEDEDGMIFTKPATVDGNMEVAKATLHHGGNGYVRASSTTHDGRLYNFSCPPSPPPENLMDPRMYAHSTKGDVDGFIKILESIPCKNVLGSSKILCQISHRHNTCLHIAASFGHRELAEYIVRKWPDVIKMKNSDDDTPLHIAARRRDLSFVKMVMDPCRGRPSAQDLEKAYKTGTETDADELLKFVNNKGNTVLHEALINHCKEEEVVEIIQMAKADDHHPQLVYYLNNEGKSPLYLAAEANYFHVVDAIAKSQVKEPIQNGALKPKPPLHAAILGKNNVMLEKILGMEQLVHQKDEDGKTALHCAAWVGYMEGVHKLLKNQSNFDRYDRNNKLGFCPIHIAAMRGYVDIVKELLRYSPDSKELLSRNDRENFLHVAAKFGADNIVNFVLKEKWLENLINEKDEHGNTPLHLATEYGHPKVVYRLTWDKRVDLNLVNDQDATAFDVATSVEHPTTFHQRLIWTALKSAGARSAKESKVPPSGRWSNTPNSTEEYKDRVNTLLLVSTLVATVTFAAGFTMPGGYNSSDDSPNAGMAVLLMKNMFHAFVICNTLAMYTSILGTITLIWAQLGDLNLMDTALEFALSFLGVALAAMSLGFTAGVYLVVSNLQWLAIVVLSIGLICLLILFVPFLLLFLPSKNTNRILRYMSYYPFLILVWASKNHVIKR